MSKKAIFLSHLHNEQYDETKDQGRVEVTDIEGGPQASDQGVPADDGGQEHGSQLWTEVLDQRVEDGRASDGQTHHDDQVGEEGEAAERQVGPLAETGLDHLAGKRGTYLLGLKACTWRIH